MDRLGRVFDLCVPLPTRASTRRVSTASSRPAGTMYCFPLRCRCSSVLKSSSISTRSWRCPRPARPPRFPTLSVRSRSCEIDPSRIIPPKDQPVNAALPIFSLNQFTPRSLRWRSRRSAASSTAPSGPMRTYVNSSTCSRRSEADLVRLPYSPAPSSFTSAIAFPLL